MTLLDIRLDLQKAPYYYYFKILYINVIYIKPIRKIKYKNAANCDVSVH